MLVVAGLVLLPGAGAALAVSAPTQITLETAVALAFGLGYALAGMAATALAVTGTIGKASLAIAWAFVTATAWAVAVRRRSAVRHARVFARQARRSPWTTGSGMVALVAFAAHQLQVPPISNLAYEAPWRYWADGLEILHAGGIPTSSPQWGLDLVPTVSKVLLNSFESGVAAVAPNGDLAAIGALVWLAAVGLFAALLALARELGLRGASAAVPVLTLAAPSWLPLGSEYRADLLVYRVENIGRMVAVCAVVTALLAVRRRGGMRYAVLSGLMLGAGALTHLIPVLVAGAFLIWYAAGRVALRWRGVRPTMVAAGITVAVTAVVWAAGILPAGGDIGFQRAGGGSGYPGFPVTVDPTKSFQVAHLAHPRGRRTGWAIPPARVAEGAVAAAFSRGEAASSHEYAGVALLAAVSVGLLWRRRRLLGPVVLACWLTSLAFLAAGLLFSHRFRTRIPADFGPRRLFENEVLLLALLAAAAAGYALRLAVGRSRRARIGGAAALTAAAVALIITEPLPAASAQDRAGLDVMAAVSSSVPCGARMLVDRRTAGSFEVLARRVSVDEGMAPYLRPAVLREVLPVVLGAHRFFRDPAGNAAFLVEHRIDAVVVVRGAHVGGAPILRHRPVGPLAGVGGLRRVAETRSVVIYGTPALDSAARSCDRPGGGG